MGFFYDIYAGAGEKVQKDASKTQKRLCRAAKPFESVGID